MPDQPENSDAKLEKTPEGKTIALKDSPSRAEAPGYVPSLPKNSDAKLEKTPEGKTIAPKDWPSRAEAPGYVPSLPEISDAKVAKISENLKQLEENLSKQEFGKNEVI